MKLVKRFALALSAFLVSALIFASAANVLEQESTAQVVVEQAPAQPAPASPAGQPPTPIVDVPDLMRLFNKPLYTSLKESMARQPANQEDWNNLTARGLQAAEIANLVALRPVQEREGWRKGAAGLQQAGVHFADAAKAQQWDATRQAYANLIQACNNCHRVHAPDEAPQLRP